MEENIQFVHIFTTLSPPVKIFLLTVPRRCFLCGSFLFFMFCVCHAFLSVHCSLVVICWERANLLALLYVMSRVIVIFPCGILYQVWYISIPDFCLLTDFQMPNRMTIQLFLLLNRWLRIRLVGVLMVVCVNALRHGLQLFCHVGTIFYLPVLNQY